MSRYCLLLGVLLALHSLLLSASNPADYFAICAVAKMEPDILEWIEYHRRMGCSKFYIYDSAASAEHLMNGTLRSHIASGLVSHTWLPPSSHSPQQLAYGDCVAKYRERHRFMAFIDADEFIVVVNQTQSIPTALREFEGYGGVALSWKLFGSSGHIARPDGGVLPNYFNCVPNHHIKTIANMAFVQEVASPHVLTYAANHFAVDENHRPVLAYFNRNATYHKIYINHYVLKSVEDFVTKLTRGNAWGGPGRKTWKFFDDQDRQTSGTVCLPLKMPAIGSRQ